MRQHDIVHKQEHTSAVGQTAGDVVPSQLRNQPARHVECGCHGEADEEVKQHSRASGEQPSLKGSSAERAARDVLKHLDRVEAQEETVSDDPIGGIKRP